MTHQEICACPEHFEEEVREAKAMVKYKFYRTVFLIGLALVIGIVQWLRSLPWGRIGMTLGEWLFYGLAGFVATGLILYLIFELSFIKWGKLFSTPYRFITNRASFVVQYRGLKRMMTEHPELKHFTLEDIAQMALQHDHEEEERVVGQDVELWKKAFIKAQQDVN